MPGKRTNDSVDEILQEMDRQQTEKSVQGSMTERQVDDILRGIGLYEEAPGAAELGPIDYSDLPAVDLGPETPVSDDARFSTAVLDDLLKDLPSLRAARPAPAPAPQPAPARPAPEAARPAPAAPQPAPAAQLQPAAPAPQPAPVDPPQPAPARADAEPSVMDTNGLGDTTRSGIIKNFLRKMAPASGDASQGALNQGKQQFQRFFSESAAVVPDEKGRLHDPSRKKRGFLGLGSVQDTDEFVPINVSLTGDRAAPAAPSAEEPAAEEPAAPAKPKKKGLFARLFGGEPTEELYIPESRETPEPRVDEAPAAPAHRGVVFEDDTAADLPVPPMQPSMQLPVENIRSRYTAGRGNGLDMPPALDLTQEEVWAPTASEETGDDLFAELGLTPPGPSGPAPEADAQPDLLQGILPGTSTMEFLRQQAAAAAPAPAPAPAQTTGGVYRKKRTTVEFTPGQRPREAAPAEQAYRAPGPVGEPLMTDDATPLPPSAPAEETGGFTMQIGGAQDTEDTALFLDAYRQARGLHPAPAAPTGEIPLEAPAEQPAPTGEVPLAPPQEAASPFVSSIAEAINTDSAETLPEERFMQAAGILTDTGADMPGVGEPHAGPVRLDGVPADEQTESQTSPFVAAPHTAQRSYDKPEDAPAVRADLDRQVLVLGVSAIVTGVAALVLIALGVAAFGTGSALPGPLSLSGGKTPLLVTMLVLLAVACALNWRTLLWGVAGLVRTPTPDSMPALAALGALTQLIVFLAVPDLYDPARFTLLAGPAALVLCANAAGKALDARSLRAGFALVSADTEHAVARRLVESGLLQAATRGLAEPRPVVLISRPTELFKGFLNAATARRPSDKNQQQLARVLVVCAALSMAFTLIYHQDVGKAVSALAVMFCLGAPLAGTLVSALPASLMQRSAAQVGAVVPGWHDIRQLGRINVIHLTTRDLFPEGSVRLCGIKPVHKEQIDRAIIYAASLLSNSCTSMQGVFLGMLGGDRKLLSKVDDFEAVYGKGCIGWIDGERVLAGNRALMEEYGVKIPSLEYERQHTVNQRRFVYLAVSGSLFGVFQIAYQRDPDTAAVLEELRRGGMSLVVERDDFNCDVDLLEAVYALPAGTVKVLDEAERAALEPATAWLPESSGNMLHMGSFASFVGGLQAAAGAAEGERRGSTVLTASVLLSAVLALVMSVPAMGITALPLPALILYQVAWAVLALVFPILQRY